MAKTLTDDLDFMIDLEIESIMDIISEIQASFLKLNLGEFED